LVSKLGKSVLPPATVLSEPGSGASLPKVGHMVNAAIPATLVLSS